MRLQKKAVYWGTWYLWSSSNKRWHDMICNAVDQQNGSCQNIDKMLKKICKIHRKGLTLSL